MEKWQARVFLDYKCLFFRFWVFFGCFLGTFWVVRREGFSVIFQELFERLFLVVFGLFLSSFGVF